MEKQADAFIARLKALIEKYEHRTDPRAKQLKERQERILKKFEETQERIKGTQTFSRDGGSVMDVFGWMNDTIMQMYANDLAAEIETGTMEDALDLYTDLQSSMSVCVCAFSVVLCCVTVVSQARMTPCPHFRIARCLWPYVACSHRITILEAAQTCLGCQ